MCVRRFRSPENSDDSPGLAAIDVFTSLAFVAEKMIMFTRNEQQGIIDIKKSTAIRWWKNDAERPVHCQATPTWTMEITAFPSSPA